MNKKHLLVAWSMGIFLLSGCASLKDSGWFPFLFENAEEESEFEKTVKEIWDVGYPNGYDKGIQDCSFDIDYCGICHKDWNKYLKKHLDEIPECNIGSFIHFNSGSAIYKEAYERGYYAAYEACRKEVSLYCPKCESELKERPSGRITGFLPH